MQQLDLRSQPSRGGAATAYVKGLAALERDPKVRKGHFRWLSP